MCSKYLFTLLLSFSSSVIIAQTILEADGPGDTYELITSVLAPANNPIEVPDCSHPDFGRHIDEIYDDELEKYVFRFHIHKTPDDDRCVNFDRQRNEIKTYDQSPDSLLAFQGDKIEYKWKFKLDSDFQPSTSFTHIHQIKAVGGPEASMPLITLTPRKSSPDQMQLRYADELEQTTLFQTDLAPFKGVWVEAIENIFYDEVGVGQYEILITKIQGGDTLFHFVDNSIRTWKTDADFLRPKWGIYRSLNNSVNLRDEEVLFADFYIKKFKVKVTRLNSYTDEKAIVIYPNPANNELYFSNEVLNEYDRITIIDGKGQNISTQKLTTNHVSVTTLKPGIYFVEFGNINRTTSRFKIIVQ